MSHFWRGEGIKVKHFTKIKALRTHRLITIEHPSIVTLFYWILNMIDVTKTHAIITLVSWSGSTGWNNMSFDLCLTSVARHCTYSNDGAWCWLSVVSDSDLSILMATSTTSNLAMKWKLASNPTSESYKCVIIKHDITTVYSMHKYITKQY